MEQRWIKLRLLLEPRRSTISFYMPIGIRSDKKDANREFTSAILTISLNKFYFFVLESEAELPAGSPWGNVVIGEGELSSLGHQSLQRLLRCQGQGELVRSPETKLILMKCLKF